MKRLIFCLFLLNFLIGSSLFAEPFVVYEYSETSSNNIKSQTSFENEDYRHKPLMKTIDHINLRYGDKIKLANQDLTKKWKMKQEFLSPSYTTKISDIIKIK